MVIFDLYVEQGSSFTQELDLGKDYTGATIAGDVLVDEVRVSDVVTWTDDTAGTISIDMTSVQTSTLPIGKGRYDIEITDGSDVSKPIKGRVYVDGEITK